MKTFIAILTICFATLTPVNVELPINDSIVLQKEIARQLRLVPNIDDCGVIVSEEYVLAAVKITKIFMFSKQEKLLKEVSELVQSLAGERTVKIVTGVRELHIIKQLQLKLENGSITLDDLKQKLKEIS